jgi:hypothetical protein
MSFLLRIMSRASTDIFFFALMFFIFFLGFAQAGYLAFSVDVADFRTFSISLLTLVRAFVGDLDYEALSSSNRVYGPFFYILYYIVVLLVLINVFLAILNDAYTSVRQEDEASGAYDKPGPLSGGLFAIFNAIRGKPMGGKSLAQALDGTAEDDGQTSREELVKLLEQFGVGDPKKTMEDLFKEFDTDNDGYLDSDEMELVKQRMATQADAEKEEAERAKHSARSSAESDALLIMGFSNLEGRVTQLVRLSDERHAQMGHIEGLLKKLEEM